MVASALAEATVVLAEISGDFEQPDSTGAQPVVGLTSC